MPAPNTGNVMLNMLAMVRPLVAHFLGGYVTLVILIPCVSQLVRSRRLSKTEQDLAKFRSAMNTPSHTEPLGPDLIAALEHPYTPERGKRVLITPLCR